MRKMGVAGATAALAGCSSDGEEEATKQILHSNDGIEYDGELGEKGYSWEQRGDGASYFKITSGENDEYILFDTWENPEGGNPDEFNLEDDSIEVNYFTGKKIVGENTASLHRMEKIEGERVSYNERGEKVEVETGQSIYEITLEEFSGPGQNGYANFRIAEVE